MAKPKKTELDKTLARLDVFDALNQGMDDADYLVAVRELLKNRKS